MDEVSFHFTQCLDSLQIIVNNLIHNSKLVIQNVGDHCNVVFAQVHGYYSTNNYSEYLNNFIQNLFKNLQHLKHSFNPSVYFYRGTFILGNTLDRAHVSAAFFGLLCGTGIGLVIGMSLQGPCSPVSSMKAIGCVSLTGIEDITIDETVVPSISSPDEIVVKVFAASLDPVDISIASGYSNFLRKLLSRPNHNTKTHVPVILGRDCSGVVVEIGSAVSKFEIGDEVWLAVPNYHQGVLSEFVVVKEYYLGKKPKNISFEESASLPYSGTIAWDAVFHKAGLNSSNSENKRILIHCGSTGVGCILIQLCRLLGTHITVTCLSRAVQVMLGFGASYCIPLETPDLEDQLTKFRSRYDVVFNCRPGVEAHQLCMELCSKEGKVVSTVPPRLASDSFGVPLGFFYSFYVNIFTLLGRKSWGHVNFSYAILDQISNLVDSDHIKPVVGNIFKPHDHQKAFHIVDSNQSLGKTVIDFIKIK